MPVPSYPLRTARLQLRPFEADDVEPLLRIYRRADVVRYLYTDVWTRVVAAERIRQRLGTPRFEKQGDSLALAIVPHGTDRLVGDLLLFLSSEAHWTGEIGFVLHPEAQGRGYATEAARAMLLAGFEQLQLHRIIGRCDARNSSSARVLAKLGMRQEAHFRHDEYVKGEWCDTLVFAMLAHELQQQDER